MTAEELKAERVALGQRLKVARAKLRLSQEDLAEALGCNRRHLQKMETGERTITADRKRAVEMLLQGAAVPDDLRGAAQSSRRPPRDWEDGAEEIERGVPMTRGEKIGFSVLAAVLGGGFCWMLRTGARAAAAAAKVAAS